jgi:hypothetical protein
MTVSAVEVLRFNEHSSSTKILMPYIDGLSGADFAIHGDREIAKILSLSINQIIIDSLLKSKQDLVNKNIFMRKIDEVNCKIKNRTLRKLSEKIYSDLQKITDERIEFPIGQCHGDLTLSNIICSRYQGIKLIDFLSIYLESPLQDVSKIIQEYHYGWSFRYLPTSIKIKGKLFLSASLPDVVQMISVKYKPQIEILTRLTLLRIAPYLKDEITEVWLINSLSNYIEITD